MSNAGFAIDKFIQLLFGMSLLASHKTFNLLMKTDNLYHKKSHLLNN